MGQTKKLAALALINIKNSAAHPSSGITDADIEVLDARLRSGLKVSFTRPSGFPWVVDDVAAHVSDEARVLFGLASWLRSWNPTQDSDPPGSLAQEHAGIFTAGATLASWAGAQTNPLLRRGTHKLVADLRKARQTVGKSKAGWPFSELDMPDPYARSDARQASIAQVAALLREAKCDKLTPDELSALAGASATAQVVGAVARAARLAATAKTAATGSKDITSFMSPAPVARAGMLSGLIGGLRSVGGILSGASLSDDAAANTAAQATAAAERDAHAPAGDGAASPTSAAAQAKGRLATEEAPTPVAPPEPGVEPPLSQGSTALRNADAASAEAKSVATAEAVKEANDSAAVMQSLLQAAQDSETAMRQDLLAANLAQAKKRAADTALAAAAAKRMKIKASNTRMLAQIATLQAAQALSSQAAETEALAQEEAENARLASVLLGMQTTNPPAPEPVAKKPKTATIDSWEGMSAGVPAQVPHVVIPLKHATPPSTGTGAKPDPVKASGGASEPPPLLNSKQNKGMPSGFVMPPAVPAPTGAAAFYATTETMPPRPPTSMASTVWPTTPAFSRGAYAGFSPGAGIGLGAMSSRLAKQPTGIQGETVLWQQLVSGVNVPPSLGPAAPLATSTLDTQPLQALGKLYESHPACTLQAMATLRATLMGMDVPMMGEVDADNVEALTSSLNYRFNSSAIAPSTVLNIINLFMSTAPNFIRSDLQHASQLGARIAATLVESLRRLTATASRRLASSTPGGLVQYSTAESATTDDYVYDMVDSTNVPKYMKMQEDLATRLHHRQAAPDVAPMLNLFNACTTGSDTELQTAIQAVQGGLVPTDLRAAVFKTVKAASGTSVYNSLAPVRAFANGRIRRAKAIITAHKLPPNDKLVLELSLGYFGFAGILSLFRVTHGVRIRKITSPSELTMPEILEAIDMHRMLVADMGWNGWQPANQHEDLIREIRAIISMITDQGCDNFVDNLKTATLGLWIEWAALTKRHGTVEAVRGRPFPSLTVAAHLLGDESFPRFGSKVEETLILFKQHEMLGRHGFMGSMGSSPSPSPGRKPKKKAPATVHFESDSDSDAPAPAVKKAVKKEKKGSKKEKKSSKTKTAEAEVTAKNTAAAKKLLGRSPRGYPLSFALLRKWNVEKHTDSCSRQFQDVTIAGCGYKHCKYTHAELDDLVQLRKDRIGACKIDIDAGWGGVQEAANKRRAKLTPASDDDG